MTIDEIKAELAAIGERAAGWARWEWMPGMLVQWRHRRERRGANPWMSLRIDRFPSGPWRVEVTRADLTDPATIGCLAARLIEDGEEHMIPHHLAGEPSNLFGGDPWLTYCLSVARAAEEVLNA